MTTLKTKKLNIGSCNIYLGSVSEEFIYFIKKAPYLQQFNLSYNKFDSKSAYVFATMFINNKTLLTLSLSFCNITSDTLNMIIKTLKTTIVQRLYLQGNKISVQFFIRMKELKKLLIGATTMKRL